MGQLHAENDNIPFDVVNDKLQFFKHIWKPIFSDEELALWSLGTYAQIFAGIILFHFVGIFLTNQIFSKSYKHSNDTLEKLFHLFLQSSIPSTHSDWDTDVTNLDETQENWKNVKTEMKALLIFFAIEHIIMCFPIFILSINIYKRNEYLSEYFQLLPEEQHSTTLAYSFATLVPITFLLAPFLQYWLFTMYHKNGHPCRDLLNQRLICLRKNPLQICSKECLTRMFRQKNIFRNFGLWLKKILQRKWTKMTNLKMVKTLN